MTYHETPEALGITKGTCIPPVGGWKQQTYYVVEIAWRRTNPIHRAILYVGFLPDPKRRVEGMSQLTGGYTCMMQDAATVIDDGLTFSNPALAYCIKAISAIEGIGALEEL